MKTIIYFFALFIMSLSQSKLESLELLKEYEKLQLENETWDWTDPSQYPQYFYINSKPPIQCVFPFYDAHLGIVTELGDYKHSDGWKLLYKDFGSTTRTVKMPYMVLYNKYNGIMRIFAYIVTPENYTHISLQTHFEINGSANLNFASNRAYGLDWKTMYETKNAVGHAKGADAHWMYSDVPIAYDPTISSQEHVAFIFDLMGITENTIKLDGVMDLKQVDQAIISNSGNTSLDFDAFQKHVGEKFDSWSKWSGRGESYLTKAAGRVGKDTNIGKTLLEKAAVLKNAPFGVFGAIYGIADFFIGGGKTVEPTPMVFEGSVHLRGTMTTKEVIGKLKMRVPGSVAPEYDYWKPVDQVPLGIFNLKTNPVVHRLQYDQWRKDPYSDFGTKWRSYKLVSNIDPVVNQAEVILQDIQAAMVFTVEDLEISGKTDFYLLNDWVQNGFIEVESGKVGHYESKDGTVNEDRTYITYRTPFMSLSLLKNKYVNVPLTADDERKYYIDNIGIKIMAKFLPRNGGKSTVLVTTYEPKIVDKDNEQKGPWAFSLKASVSGSSVNLKWPHLFNDVVARTTFRVQESSDGSTWVTLYSKEYPEPEYRSYNRTPSSSGEYRWYRLHMSDSYGLNVYSDMVKVTNPNYVAPKPITMSISGPTYLQPNQKGTFTANTQNGSGSYTYDWWWMWTDNGSGGGDPKEPIPLEKKIGSDPIAYYVPGNEWVKMSTTSKSISFGGYAGHSYKLKCVVKDTKANTTVTGYHSFRVASSSDPYMLQQNLSMNGMEIPTEYVLKNNYPNPFNPVTNIPYALPKASQVRITVYNMLGQVVKIFDEGVKQAGNYSARWDASNVASGVYIYEIRAGEFQATKKMILMK